MSRLLICSNNSTLGHPFFKMSVLGKTCFVKGFYCIPVFFEFYKGTLQRDVSRETRLEKLMRLLTASIFSMAGGSSYEGLRSQTLSVTTHDCMESRPRLKHQGYTTHDHDCMRSLMNIPDCFSEEFGSNKGINTKLKGFT